MHLESKKILEDIRLAAAHIVENTVVWDVIQQDLPKLHGQVKNLLS